MIKQVIERSMKRGNWIYIIGMAVAVGIHCQTQLWQILFCIKWWFLVLSTIAIFTLLYVIRMNYRTVTTVPINLIWAGTMVKQLETMGKPLTWLIYATNLYAGMYMYYNGLVLAPLIIAVTLSLAMINALTLKPYLKRLSQRIGV